MTGKVLLTASLLLSVAAPMAVAQNLVVNANFDTNVDFWTVPFPFASLAWTPLDWNANPNSGSALLTNDWTLANGLAVATGTCLVVPTTGVYEYGAHILIPSGQATTGEVFVARGFWESPGCVGIVKILIDQVVPTTTTDVWVPILIQGVSQSAGTELSMFLGVTKDQPTGTLAAHFDFVRFGLQGTTPVRLLGFAVE